MKLIYHHYFKFILVFLILSFLFLSSSALYAQSYLSNVLQAFKGSANVVKASFSYSPIIPITGLAVKFLDKSTGNPNFWQWDFGDGTISNEQNPSHTYNLGGIYKVTLTVKLNDSTSTVTKKIRVYAAKTTSTSTSTKTSELTPSFDFSPVTPEAGMTVQFTDSSSGGPTSWSWDFGDGGKSTLQNPQHQYQTAGSFSVSLIVSNGTTSKSLTKSITVVPVLTPAFNFYPTNPEAGESIQFQDISSGNPSTWSWNFGDGSTSSLKNPTHAYSSAGTYTVSLQVSNGYYTKNTSQNIIVLAPISVDFSFNPTSPIVGQDVQFTNNSTGSIDTYLWNFGDGSTSTLKNPVHKYSNAGSFTVTLTVTNSKGSKSKSQTITVNQSLSPSFTFSPSSPYVGQSIQFTDTSSGAPSSWQWNFGDGVTSNVKNPTHTYSTAGNYTVSLTIANSSESKTASKSIVVSPTVQADFTFSPSNPTVGTTVQFTDKSSGNITSWSWKFGDGGTSTEKNPSHVYNSAGSYNVTLTVSDGTSSNSMIQTITIAAALTADFRYSPSSPIVGQQVQFMDNSQGLPTSWSWDFGDGANSTIKNPTHSYSQAGSFTVKLTVSDGINSSTKSNSLTVSSSSNRIITAASCELSDVQAAIGQANAGDTVVVPNGTARWTSPLVVNKGIILKAATSGGVTILNNTPVSSPTGYSNPDNFVIAFVPLDSSTGQPFRLSGFIIDGGGNRWTFLGKTNSDTLVINQFRIDHCTFQNSYNNCSMVFYGEIYGVIDNCILNGGVREFSKNEATWSNFTFNYGSANNRYYEDNVINFYDGFAFIEGGMGGRYAYRYNVIYNMQTTYGLQPLFDMHGNMGTGGNLSTMGAEIYGNIIYCNNKSIGLFDQRGGKVVAFNNTIYNANGATPGKAREEYYDYLNPPATNPAGQPQHVSESYYWNNAINGSVSYGYYISDTLDYGENGGIVPRWDVYCFKHVQNFDGSSGIGVGLLSQRPTSCTTEGVGWWATDENKLYRWKNGKWELYYVPYTYPHPLRTALGD